MELEKRVLTLRFLAEPGDVNFGGKVHGGSVMKWIDQAGYACASQFSSSYCVTVYVGGIQFLKPIRIGSLVEVVSKVVYTGRTSMHISVDVFATDTRSNKKVKTTHCIIIFVAVDDHGRKVEVPKWVPRTDEDRGLEEYAKELVALRSGIKQHMQNKL